MYSIFVTFICRILHLPVVLYNQTALWDAIPTKTDVPHKIVNKLTPSIRITPVLGNTSTGYLQPNSYYVPFVIESHQAPSEKTYFVNDFITILCIAKYESRKNQLMLLESLSHYVNKIPFKLVFVGELSTQHHRDYHKKLQDAILKCNMSDIVTCYANCKPDEMNHFYENADIFVLPSTSCHPPSFSSNFACKILKKVLCSVFASFI